MLLFLGVCVDIKLNSVILVDNTNTSGYNERDFAFDF